MVFAYFRRFPRYSTRLFDFNHGATVQSFGLARRMLTTSSVPLFSTYLMNNATVVFDPYATNDLCNIVQTIVDNHNIAVTGQAEWYPVTFFLRDENGEVLGGLLGDIWAALLHVRTLAVVAPVRGHGFGKELMKR